MRTHLVVIRFSSNDQFEEEAVLVEANSLQQAASLAMRHNTIPAVGRFVQFFDADGNQIHANSI